MKLALSLAPALLAARVFAQVTLPTDLVSTITALGPLATNAQILSALTPAEIQELCTISVVNGVVDLAGSGVSGLLTTLLAADLDVDVATLLTSLTTLLDAQCLLVGYSTRQYSSATGINSYRLLCSPFL